MALDALTETGLKIPDFDRIVVTLGPGSFTGVRVGLAFAKGLATGSGVALKGVGTLTALGHLAELEGHTRLACVNGGRGQVYVQAFPTGEAVTLTVDDEAVIAEFAARTPVDSLTGPAASLIAHRWPKAVEFPQNSPSLAAIARLGQNEGNDDLKPLYMRDADAIASTRGIITLEG